MALTFKSRLKAFRSYVVTDILPSVSSLWDLSCPLSRRAGALLVPSKPYLDLRPRTVPLGFVIYITNGTQGRQFVTPGSLTTGRPWRCGRRLWLLGARYGQAWRERRGYPGGLGAYGWGALASRGMQRGMDDSYAIQYHLILRHQLIVLVAPPADFGPGDESRNLMGPGEVGPPYHPHNNLVDIDFDFIVAGNRCNRLFDF